MQRATPARQKLASPVAADKRAELLRELETRAKAEHAKAWPKEDDRAQLFASYVRPRDGQTWADFVRREIGLHRRAWDPIVAAQHAYLSKRHAAAIEAHAAGLGGVPTEDLEPITWEPLWQWSETTTAATKLLDRVILTYGREPDGPFWETRPGAKRLARPEDHHLALLAALAGYPIGADELEGARSLQTWLKKLANTIGQRRRRRKK